MSLVPYSSRDSREIVLRHNDAIVVRDPQTQQLVLRGANSTSNSTSHSISDGCPTCHRPFRPSSPDRSTSPHRSPPLSSTFISPDYFRMLHAANRRRRSDAAHPPSSPIRRLVQPAFLSGNNTAEGSVPEAEFVASTPASDLGHSIKKEAFSPNYFKRFFIEQKELGRGGKGVVLLVKHELDGVSLGEFACKRVPVGDDHAWLEKVLIEVQLLQGLSHPNLVSYRHVWLEDVKLNRFSPSVPCAFILQQYCNSGDLLRYIAGPLPAATSTKEQLKEQLRRRSRGGGERPDWQATHRRKLAFEEIFSFFKDIASGLAHLHTANYIHRDLKPSNCLLHQDANEMKCLISDFGEVQSENAVRKNTGSTGTISYCAPEVLRKDDSGRYGNFTTKSDIFSLGMILYFMCFGRLPYKSADSIQEDNEDIDLLRAEISSWTGFQGERKERPDLPSQLYGFLKRLLAIDPADRPSAHDILHALQTEKGLDNLPRKRSGASQGLGGRIHPIDSPIPPSTPVNEPTKRAFSGAYIEDASPESPPSPPLKIQIVREKNHSGSLSRSNSTQSPSLKITPLLMPPPSTRVSAFKQQISLHRHYLVSWATLNQQALYLLMSLLIFVAKVFSLTKPCSGNLPVQWVWWSLVGLAGLELAISSRIDWKSIGVFAVAHTVLLVGAINFGGGLCGVQTWELG